MWWNGEIFNFLGVILYEILVFKIFKSVNKVIFVDLVWVFKFLCDKKNIYILCIVFKFLGVIDWVMVFKLYFFVV